MMTWRCLPASDIDAHTWDAWEQLCQSTTEGHPLLDSIYLRNLLKVFGTGKERLCVLDDGASWRAALWVLPNSWGRWELFLPAQAQVGLALLHDPVHLAGLLQCLPGRALALDLLCQDPDLLATEALRPAQTEVVGHALTMSVPLTDGFDTYWASRSTKLKQNIRRYVRKLKEAGWTGKIVALSGESDVQAGVKRYATLEASGWKGRAGTALGSDAQQLTFYSDVMCARARQGDALVCELWLGEQLLASRLILLSRKRIVFLKTSYDEAFADYSPGRVLLYEVLQHLYAAFPDKVLEFYTNADADLLPWGVKTRYISHVRVHRSAETRALLEWPKWLASRLRKPQELDQSKDALQIESFAHPREMPADVREFMDRAEEQCLEFGADWFGLLIDDAPVPGDQPNFYVLRQRDRIALVLPIAYRRQSNEVVSLDDCYTSLYRPITRDGVKADAAALATVIRRINSDHQGVARWLFAPMDPSHPSYQLLLDAMRLAGLVPLRYFRFGNWYEPAQDWATYWGSRHSQLISTVTRRGKKFSERGGRLEIIVDAGRAEAGLAAFQTVYSSSWKSAEPFERFVPNLVRKAVERGWLRLGVAWLHERPVAAQIWLVESGKASIFKLAHDESLKDLSAGTLLSARMFEYAFVVDKVNEVDFLIGDDQYKRAWTGRRRERWGLVAFNPSTLRGLAGLCREVAGRILRRYLKRGKS